LGAREALGFKHAPVLIGYGELENGLCKIDGNGSSIHFGLLTLKDLIPIPMTTSTQLLRKKTGESIPSLNLTLCGGPILVSISFQPKSAPPQSAG
jgi:hypothetical protein